MSKQEKDCPWIFLAISLALFLGFIGFFVWHTVRMRSYELNYLRMQGTIVDIKVEHSSGGSGWSAKTSYYYIISYEVDGEEYTFTDRSGHEYYSAYSNVGKTTEIYINPQDPTDVEKVSSAPFVSIICACFYAFFSVTFAAGMNILVGNYGTTFLKRLLFVWGAEILLGIIVLLLFWIGLPNSGFGEVFTRINGAIGVTVISGLVLLIALIDGIVTHHLHSKYGDRKYRF
ncbi:MAG: DUF3592 domain-containing protein [Clostridiales bacterium]|nr:DUF3592 domain-containing protein [Clostridiales bacterium]